MIDIKRIRENPALIAEAAKNKNENCDIEAIIKLDEKRREIISEVDVLKATRNKVSAEIAAKKKSGESADDAISDMRNLGDKISEFDVQLRETDEQLHDAISRVPNIPHDSVPIGKSEADNKLIREWGEKPKFDFDVLPHWEIGKKLDILDLDAAGKVSGAGFYILKGAGARLERALINYMLDMHTADGFTEVSVPHLVNSDSMYGTGQLPKLADDMYKTTDGDMYLIPTAEVPITNMFKQEILDFEALPIYRVAHTPCYRREAGAAGKDTRGMIRVHQFAKVELVKIVRPENSYDELESLVNQAEKVLQGLGLSYRVVSLASGDLSFAAAKCYDLELWAPGVGKYLEISSISNFEDFQARRMKCRFRDEDKKVKFPHTLNGSGVALARLVPAILENFQNSDGTVTIPAPLRPYMQGAEIIG